MKETAELPLMTRISLVLVPINLQRQRRDQILTLGAHCPSSFHFQHSLLCIINQYHARVLILYIKKRISRSISDFVFCFLFFGTFSLYGIFIGVQFGPKRSCWWGSY